MDKLDRKNIHGKTICDVLQFVKVIVRAGMEEIPHRRNVSMVDKYHCVVFQPYVYIFEYCFW